MRFDRLLFVFMAICLPAGLQAASWRHVPVPGAQVHDLVILPGGRLLAATNDGVYRSENAGQSWARTQSVSPSKAFLRLHVVDGDPQMLVAYTYDTTQYGGLALEASRDGGATWQVTFTDRLYSQTGHFSSHPAAPRTVLFTEAHIVLRSDDAGMTWSDFSGNQLKRTVFPVGDQPGRYVAALYRSDRLLESNDAGATWTHLELQPQLPDRDYVRFEQDPAQPSVLYYAAYQTGGQAALSGKVNTRTGAVIPFTDACGCTHVRVVPDPHRSGRLIAPSVAFDPVTFAVTGRPLRESLDGGATWHELGRLTRQLEDDYRWQFDPWTSGRIYLPTAGAGVYRSDNDGLTFTQRYQGMNAGLATYLSVDPRNPADFLVARQLLPMLHSSDGGNTFSAVRMDFYSDYVSPSPSRPRVARAWTDPAVLVGFDAQSFYRSEDGGRTWQAMASDFPFTEVLIRAIQFTGSGSDKLAVLAEQADVGHQLYWSSDGGRHWTSTDFGGWASVNRLGAGGVDVGPIYARRESYMSQQDPLWVVDAFGGAPRFVTLPSNGALLLWSISAPDPSNPLRVLAFSENWSSPNHTREVFETLDAGATWNRMGSSDLIGGIPVVDACDGRTVWETIMGRASRDGGRHFGAEVYFARYLAHGFHALCFEGKSHVLALSSRGISIREPEAGDTLLREGHDP